MFVRTRSHPEAIWLNEVNGSPLAQSLPADLSPGDFYTYIYTHSYTYAERERCASCYEMFIICLDDCVT